MWLVDNRLARMVEYLVLFPLPSQAETTLKCTVGTHTNTHAHTHANTQSCAPIAHAHTYKRNRQKCPRLTYPPAHIAAHPRTRQHGPPPQQLRFSHTIFFCIAACTVPRYIYTLPSASCF
mmetsp:Transcript_80216/g.117568  ORF Transcript_80216/g.117568 Transcript_80216/m.117568 type:complete len:120 (-) Transcript_80216:9-368(-)